MPRCPYCRAINKPDALSCVRCQKALAPQPRQEAETSPFRSPESPKNVGGYEATPFADAPSLVGEPPGPVPEIPAAGLSALEHFSADAPNSLVSREACPSDSAAMPYWGETTLIPPLLGEDVPRHWGGPPTLVGLVFQTRDLPAEPPDFDIFLWLSRFLGLVLILGLPLLLFWHAYRRWGVILLLILIILLFLMARFANAIIMLSALGLGRILGRPFQASESVPVRTCRIMDDQQTEAIVRIKGRIIRGDLDQHDRVAVWGSRRRGTLNFRQGYNFRTRSWIDLEGRYTWILALTLAILDMWLIYALLQTYTQPRWHPF